MIVIFGTFSLGTNAFAWSIIDWQVNSAGEPTNYEVIEGQIKRFDIDKMEITFEKCQLIGKMPLKLTKETEYFKGDIGTDIVSARGGSEFQEKDKIDVEYLKAGDHIKCNFKIDDKKFWAKMIVLITPYVRVD
jgi:hypothetical protein